MHTVVPTDEENSVLADLRGDYATFTEMAPDEHRFLNSLLLRHKPEKVLELGISAGGTSVVILNALAKNNKGKLHSVDYLDHWYKDPARTSGFVVNGYPELQSRQTVLCGGMANTFMEKIGGDIDFCVIDTTHMWPGEALEYLIVLPYLKSGCVVVLHDVGLHGAPRYLDVFSVNRVVWSLVPGEKLLPAMVPNMDILNFETYFTGQAARNAGSGHERQPLVFPNIGAAILAPDAADRVWDVFNTLRLDWSYCLSQEESGALVEYFGAHYGKRYGDMFQEIASYQDAARVWREMSRDVKRAGLMRLCLMARRECYRVKVLFYKGCIALASAGKTDRYRKKLARDTRYFQLCGEILRTGDFR